MEIKVLLVIPDQEISETIRDFLAKEKEVKILGEAKTAFEALELLENIPYDLFLVSTHLSGGVDGFELAQILNQRKQRPKIVFVARDEALAFKAFEVGAIDYLLWPFIKERMLKTIERIQHLLEPPDHVVQRESVEDEDMVHLDLKDEEQEDILKALKEAWKFKERKVKDLEKLPINQDGKLILVPYHQIVFVEAYEDYSYVHTPTERYLTSYRLKNLEKKLTPYGFFRIHRKYLVNLEMVTEIASLPGSNFMLRTAGKKKIELPISRRRIGELKGVLGL